ncbi:MAG TPA: S8/S53 family peptidase, partial [Anaerolineales bacterium]|nr:S8/S53 family peptidase [Anaerolineales bacterium]
GSRKNAPYVLNIVEQLQKKNIYGTGAGVDVAILDTAPSAQALVSAYKEWPDHPLISTLLGPQGKLHLYPASYEDHWRMNCTSLNDHDYKMTDHGLFIAGLIHSIAPEAEIHLIEVLNQYGVGDFMSFVQGLQTVQNEIYDPGQKLCINCSWMLEFPREDRHSRHKNKMGDPDAEFARRVLELSSALDQSLLLTLQDLFNRFYGVGRQAMAAAGNDNRKEDTDGVLARYPAALRRVQGVGALPKSLEKGQNEKYIPSVFSNLSDAPDKKGIMTLGGEEGDGKGVLGLYIGEFPGCCRNESKWAWWAGTSFATPILTGTVAAVLSNNTPNTQEALKKLYATAGGGFKLIEDGKARRQEDAMPVTQS